MNKSIVSEFITEISNELEINPDQCMHLAMQLFQQYGRGAGVLTYSSREDGTIVERRVRPRYVRLDEVHNLRLPRLQELVQTYDPARSCVMVVAVASNSGDWARKEFLLFSKPSNTLEIKFKREILHKCDRKDCCNISGMKCTVCGRRYCTSDCMNKDGAHRMCTGIKYPKP
jgi:hypothetical protein